jgi:energy-coupling factor transport system permease protein
VLIPTYRRRASVLHSARASVASAFCAAFGLAALLNAHPVVLLAIACAVVGAGMLAGSGVALLRSVRIAVPFALVIVVINALVSQRGVTVVFRGGEVFGHRFDVTAESLAWGGVTALRLTCLFLAFGLFSAVVDPDELLKLMRRWSYRSALTASLATRLVPVLARDATRMGDAARCRPKPPGKLEVTRAALTGALERSVDVAAALEVRGYSAAKPPRRERRAWSRHDIRVGAAALLVAGVSVVAAVAGVGAVRYEPTVALSLGPDLLALSVAMLAGGVLPFAGAGARLGVARG